MSMVTVTLSVRARRCQTMNKFQQRTSSYLFGVVILAIKSGAM